MRQAFRRAEDEMIRIFGSKVRIKDGKKKGVIEIEYYSPDELDRIVCLIKKLT
jgi:ParB family chromosome partitioning protein